MVCGVDKLFWIFRVYWDWVWWEMYDVVYGWIFILLEVKIKYGWCVVDCLWGIGVLF